MYEQALELAEQYGGQPSIALCFVHRGRARLFYERNDLDEARHALEESIHVGEIWKHPGLLGHPYGLSALVMLARGQANEAREMIRYAEQITHDSYSTPAILGSLACYQIALWIVQNDFQAIAKWEQGHDSEWLSQIGREREHLVTVLARAYIMRYYHRGDNSALRQALDLIEPALEGAQASGLTFHVVRLLILKALALYAQEETVSAITTLKSALALTEPENYIRSFIDIGKPMEEFLSWSLGNPALSEPQLRTYVSRLLSYFAADLPSKSSQPAGITLIEPLTDRELEVLRLVAQGHSNREISERLFLALSTVKGYNRIVFDKLQVQRRTEAIVRARQLGLL